MSKSIPNYFLIPEEERNREEAELFNKLKDWLDDNYLIVKYFPPAYVTGFREIDIAVFGVDLGCIVIEVKGHSIDKLEWEPQANRFLFYNKGKNFVRTDLRRTNPFSQAVYQSCDLRNFLNREFLFGFCVAFPQISRSDWQKKFATVPYFYKDFVDENFILFKDDICKEHIRNKLIRINERIRQRPQCRYRPMRITNAEMSEIEASLTYNYLSDAKGQPDFKKPLADFQNKILMRPYGKKYLVIGPVGSGKTEILLNRAKLWKTYKDNCKILIITSNMPIAEYIANKLTKMIDPNGERCRYYTIKKNGRTELFGCDRSRESDFYWGTHTLITNNISVIYVDWFTKKLAELNKKPDFDAIFVDEGHLLSESDYQQIMKCQKTGKDMMVFAAQDQKIYSNKQVVFKTRINIENLEKTINPDEPPHYLNVVYRNSINIFRFASLFNSQNNIGEENKEILRRIAAGEDLYGKTTHLAASCEYGENPVICLYKGTDIIQKLEQQIINPYNDDCAVLCDIWDEKDNNWGVNGEALTQSRILKHKIHPIHRATGLEFDTVFIVKCGKNLKLETPIENDDRIWREIFYLGFTRAIYKLVIFLNEQDNEQNGDEVAKKIIAVNRKLKTEEIT
ncbi:MAG: DEAD/DEAH box helicase family protein [candidate division WOR-3 bacterium]